MAPLQTLGEHGSGRLVVQFGAMKHQQSHTTCIIDVSKMNDLVRLGCGCPYFLSSPRALPSPVKPTQQRSGSTFPSYEACMAVIGWFKQTLPVIAGFYHLGPLTRMNLERLKTAGHSHSVSN